MAKKFDYQGTTSIHRYKERKSSNAGWWIFGGVVIFLWIIAANGG